MIITLEDKDIKGVAKKVIEMLQGKMLTPTSFLGPDEPATHLNIPKRWIYDRTRENGIQPVRIKKYLRFSLPEFLNGQKINDE